MGLISDNCAPAANSWNHVKHDKFIITDYHAVPVTPFVLTWQVSASHVSRGRQENMSRLVFVSENLLAAYLHVKDGNGNIGSYSSSLELLTEPEISSRDTGILHEDDAPRVSM